jgi:hypothetical protein
VFNAAYESARMAGAVYVGIERRGRGWTVKADTLAAGPALTVDKSAQSAICDAAVRLVRRGEIRAGSGLGPVHYTLNGVESEGRAREIAAALHAALYGDAEPLARAVPA